MTELTHWQKILIYLYERPDYQANSGELMHWANNLYPQINDPQRRINEKMEPNDKEKIDPNKTYFFKSELTPYEPGKKQISVYTLTTLGRVKASALLNQLNYGQQTNRNNIDFKNATAEKR